MSNVYTWQSNIGNHIAGFLNNKRLSGYRYNVPERWLKQFDQYCAGHHVPCNKLPRDIVEGFCYHDGVEAKATFEYRLRLLRDLGTYMTKAGCDAYIAPKPPRAFKYPVTTQATAWDLEIRQLRPRTAGHTSNFKTSVQFGT